MIKEFIAVWDSHKAEIQASLEKEHPDSYKGLVAMLISLLHNHLEGYNVPDPERITVIDHGDYQGTLLFIVGAAGYQPSTYWSIFVSYGSCSACDTFQGIRDDNYGDVPTAGQVADYMTLVLHMLQSMCLVGTED